MDHQAWAIYSKIYEARLKLMAHGHRVPALLSFLLLYTCNKIGWPQKLPSELRANCARQVNQFNH